ncbi:carbohydrate ABC transporter permease [Blautia pseudococcoides]|uniref:carbohydrate ABC transporter permease n=1 Tax=Blautia pseudococcoides TaxID=1796616 RepID=UPI00148B06E7|nr:carbohydrate ABC transporter permease [Blautia pseudococcoides]QJU16229.1 carbohydrate ABC transporter permease [Blautia pseudococcoides]
MKVSAKDKVFLVLKYVVLGIFTVLCLYPLLWLFLSSFKTNTELYANPWGLPEQFRLDNYIQAITEGHILQYFGNSVMIAVSAVLVAVVLSSMVSYAITRMQWRLSKLTLNVFLLGMMIPVYAMVVPLFSMFNRMGLLNTHLAVIIPHIAMAFPMAIFIMTGFMGSLPKEMEEAAVMDGCNIYQMFFKIIMPISKSSVVTVAVVTFINIWNDLLLPQIFLTDASKMTLPVGLTEFQGQYATNYVAEIAAVIITIIPSIIVYIWLHKHIMEGMVAGAVKG